MMLDESGSRRQILDLVAAYSSVAFTKQPFVAGESLVPVSGRVFDASEVVALVDSSLDFWLTTGRWATEFERLFTEYMGVRHAVLCNSGSSANLLAIAALTSEKLGDRRLRSGDEVITCATGFPTTVNPAIQHGLIPVFVDAEPTTYNADPQQIEAAVGPRTRAIMMAHTLGNPFDLDTVLAVAKRHDLWLIEDNCDAVGSTYRGAMTSTFGDIATVSFYPAHHLTMGEGGCVLTQRGPLKKLIESFRDWGRDCWCEPGAEDTCGRRFDWQLGQLPYGYDHKYIYSHVGYNLKLTDMQAAVGVAQMEKVPTFVEARKRNWHYLREGFAGVEHLILPTATPNSDPSWFGFCLAVAAEAPFSRHDLVRFLEQRRIGTRELFAGNLTRQPAYKDVPLRIVGNLENADAVMRNAFWIGVYPGLTLPILDYVIESIREFVAAHGQLHR